MNRELLIQKIQGGNPTKEDLLKWVKCLPASERLHNKPKRNRIGDCYMHPIFNHPYILLEKKGDYWICGLITSEVKCTEILEPCRSRFFHNNYFTRVIFTASSITGAWMGTYDNPKHLRSVRANLKSCF